MSSARHILIDRIHRRRRELQRRRAQVASPADFLAISPRNDESVEADLELAGQIQRRFQPRDFQSFGDYEVGSAVLPAGPVCGDIFDVATLANRWVACWLVDATGHGVAAGMLTAYLQSHLRRIAWDRRNRAPRRPDRALALLNRLLLAHQPEEPMFVATVLCLLDLQTHRITLARGGSPIPMVVHADGDVEPVISCGRLVGIVPGNGFETAELELQPGESLVLWSDGLERLVDGECAIGDGSAPSTVDFTAIAEGRVPEALEHLRVRWWHGRQTGLCDDDVSIAIVRRKQQGA